MNTFCKLIIFCTLFLSTFTFAHNIHIVIDNREPLTVERDFRIKLLVTTWINNLHSDEIVNIWLDQTFTEPEYLKQLMEYIHDELALHSVHLNRVRIRDLRDIPQIRSTSFAGLSLFPISDDILAEVFGVVTIL